MNHKHCPRCGEHTDTGFRCPNGCDGSCYQHGVVGQIILVSKSMGVYLGYCMGLGFWTKLDAAGLEEAVTFESRKDAEEHISEWECLAGMPSDFSYLPVNAKNKGYATKVECVEAGADTW